jgi:hypothetical protein
MPFLASTTVDDDDTVLVVECTAFQPPKPTPATPSASTEFTILVFLLR